MKGELRAKLLDEIPELELPDDVFQNFYDHCVDVINEIESRLNDMANTISITSIDDIGKICDVKDSIVELADELY